MESLLQIDLSSSFDKSMYSIQKNSIRIIGKSDSRVDQYQFDSICYNWEDINERLLFRMVTKLTEDEGDRKLYTVVFDQIDSNCKIDHFIQKMKGINMFKKKEIRVAHFTPKDGWSLHDYNQYLQTQDQQQQTKAHRTLQEAQMSSLQQFQTGQEDIKPHEAQNIASMVTYIDANQHLANNQTIPGSHQTYNEIENHKVNEYYIIKIDTQIQINFILFNTNRKNTLHQQQSQQITDIFGLYGYDVPEFKYRTMKGKIINGLLKRTNHLFYVCYFPGRLWKSTHKGSKSMKHTEVMGMTRNAHQHAAAVFGNYSSLHRSNNEPVQNTIARYINRKQQVLQSELEKAEETVKDLSISHRVSNNQLHQLKQIVMKIISKMAPSIKQLHKMGIKNIGKQIAWLSANVQLKAKQIQQLEQEIDQINFRIHEGRNRKQYYIRSRTHLRDKLKNRLITANSATNRFTGEPSEQQVDDQTPESQLTNDQQEQLQLYRENLRMKMHKRLINCPQRKLFVENLRKIKAKISKIQFSKLQQKYYYLMID